MKNNVLIILLLLLVSCQRQPEITSSLTSTPPANNLDSMLSPTVLSPTKSTITETSSVPIDAKLTIQCLNIESVNPANKSIQGELALSDRVLPDMSISSIGKRDSYILNLETGEKLFLARQDTPIDFISVSPDGTLIAYRKINDNVLEIINNKGEKLKDLPWNSKWKFLTGWVNNENVVIELDEEQPATLITLNPFTEGIVVLPPDFPDIYKIDAHLDWDGWGETVYNSTADKVVYATEYGFVLWDLRSHQRVTIIPTLASFNSMTRIPKWSPDDKQFVISAPASLDNPQLNQEELFGVTTDGLITRLTYLTNYFHRVTIKNWSWSPDGRYVAFMLYASQRSEGKYDSNEGEQLAVFDTKTNIATLYCVPGLQIVQTTDMFPARYAAGSSIVPAPIWSPDNKRILIENRFAENSSKLILVNLSDASALILGENIEPLGWISTGQ